MHERGQCIASDGPHQCIHMEGAIITSAIAIPSVTIPITTTTASSTTFYYHYYNCNDYYYSNQYAFQNNYSYNCY